MVLTFKDGSTLVRKVSKPKKKSRKNVKRGRGQEVTEAPELHSSLQHAYEKPLPLPPPEPVCGQGTILVSGTIATGGDGSNFDILRPGDAVLVPHPKKDKSVMRIVGVVGGPSSMSLSSELPFIMSKGVRWEYIKAPPSPPRSTPQVDRGS